MDAVSRWSPATYRPSPRRTDCLGWNGGRWSGWAWSMRYVRRCCQRSTAGPNHPIIWLRTATSMPGADVPGTLPRQGTGLRAHRTARPADDREVGHRSARPRRRARSSVRRSVARAPRTRRKRLASSGPRAAPSSRDASGPSVATTTHEASRRRPPCEPARSCLRPRRRDSRPVSRPRGDAGELRGDRPHPVRRERRIARRECAEHHVEHRGSRSSATGRAGCHRRGAEEAIDGRLREARSRSDVAVDTSGPRSRSAAGFGPAGPDGGAPCGSCRAACRLALESHVERASRHASDAGSPERVGQAMESTAHPHDRAPVERPSSSAARSS